jgi:hypothetical protein
MFSKFWHSALSIGIIVFSVVAPQIQTVISHHPIATTVLGGIWAIIGHLLPSPILPTK